jgi:hypothetical protein
MQSAILIALAATTLYAHGTCGVAPPSTSAAPPARARAEVQPAKPAITVASTRVGTAPSFTKSGGHCSLASLPFAAPDGTRVVAYDARPTAAAADDVPTPWGCYALTPHAQRVGGAEGSQTSCAPFPTVDALPEDDPFS